MSYEDQPLYFDIAFQHRDIGRECDFVESVLELYSKTDNRRILDVNCGTGSHMLEFFRRGYQVDGMETSQSMIDYIKENPAFKKFSPALWEDTLDLFSTERKYGLLINMLTSFNYLITNESVLSHLESAAKALSQGGIYIIEANHPRDLLAPQTSAPNKWIEVRDDIEVEVDWDYKNAPLDFVKQFYHVKGSWTVRRGDKEELISVDEDIRIFLYQEIRTLIQLNGKLTLKEAYGAFNVGQPLDNTSDSWRMILVLRKE